MLIRASIKSIAKSFFSIKYKIQFKKFSNFGNIPLKATPGSACFNIFSSSDLT